MKPELLERVDTLRRNFQEITGQPFRHFYCPILFTDEPTELCQAHVFNRKFPSTDRTWTVQRADIDAFFGTLFEADFLALELKGKHAPIEALDDPRLYRQLRPRIVVAGEEVPFYRGTGTAPSDHTRVTISSDGRRVPLILKLSESDVLGALKGRWEVGVQRDLRLPTLVSMLKAAHLTLFHLLGYRYALSAAGHFLGWGILGNFYRQYSGKPRNEALAGAYEHFFQFRNMARPILEAPDDLQATVTSRLMYLCRTDAWPWAMLIFLRTGSHRHAVLVPIFENHHAIARYLNFLRSPDREFEAHMTQLRDDDWEVSTRAQRFEWPKSRF